MNKDGRSNGKLLLVGSLALFYCNYMQAGNTNNLGQNTSKNINTITTAVPFLMIAPDSRAGAMGDAGVASSPDANSIHWNCSKLAFEKKQMGLAISYTPWLRELTKDINLAYLSGFYKLKHDQTIATSLRYFSLGDITFTDQQGQVTGQFRPNEFAVDVAYARKLAERWSGGMALRYISSNLTGGQMVGGESTHPGRSVAVDLSTYYQNSDIRINDKSSVVRGGLNISNIGSKMSYSSSPKKDFIPINMRLGGSLTMNLDKYNSFTIMTDLNKLLVPTPPIYELDSTGAPVVGPNGQYVILKGKDPNRSVVNGILGSFSDAPGGYKEELREITESIGIEYWYDNQFAIRAGFFHEDPTKGNRQYFTLGAGLKYNVFGLDLAYLIPTEQKNPLQNTLRFTLLFDFDAFKSQNKKSEAKG